MTDNFNVHNIIGRTDSYKLSHAAQYPSDTCHVSSYIEPRVDRDDMVFMGMKAFIQDYLMKPFTKNDIDEAEELVQLHGFSFDRTPWEAMLSDYGGFLPLAVQAVHEGTVMKGHNAQVQVMNTSAMYPWLTSRMETAMLRAIWYPSSVATISRDLKRDLMWALEKSSDEPETAIQFMLHDFGARGASSGETAALGGMAHLINFLGTDTFEAVMKARKVYGEPCAGFSVAASEHSTTTSWGRNGEADFVENMLSTFGGEGKIVSCVADSYNVYEFTSKIVGERFKEKIETFGGRFVVRPDSGDVMTVPIEIVEILMDKFGYTVNSKGYKVLPTYIRVLQGDGLNSETLPLLIRKILEKGISIENFVFGMGGGLLQNVTRDTFKYAMKASARMGYSGRWMDVYKDPIHGGKTSKRGRLAVVERDGVAVTIREDECVENNEKNLLNLVYINGNDLMVGEGFDFASIRARAAV